VTGSFRRASKQLLRHLIGAQGDRISPHDDDHVSAERFHRPRGLSRPGILHPRSQNLRGYGFRYCHVAGRRMTLLLYGLGTKTTCSFSGESAPSCFPLREPQDVLSTRSPQMIESSHAFHGMLLWELGTAPDFCPATRVARNWLTGALQGKSKFTRVSRAPHLCFIVVKGMLRVIDKRPRPIRLSSTHADRRDGPQSVG
jgi:hypothetical protein